VSSIISFCLLVFIPVFCYITAWIEEKHISKKKRLKENK
jgi:hypothetical protein